MTNPAHPLSPPTPDHASVAVLGLGPMGSAIALALIRAGASTTVWNRSAEKSLPLAGEGAAVAPDADAAVAAADLVLVVLRDHAAVREVLGSLEPAVFEGKTVVVLASSTPEEGRRTAAWAAGQGIALLNAAIMVPTPLIGDPGALVLYAGDRGLFDQHVETLRLLAGRADHLGVDHGLAAVYDVAMLEVFFAGMTAFLHASALVTGQGVDAKTFLPYAQQITEVLAHSMTGLAADVDAGSHPGTEDNLAMELAAIRHIVDTGAELGLDPRLPHLLHEVARTAVDEGHGDESFSRVVDVLRRG